jgi:hypothetical protein
MTTMTTTNHHKFEINCDGIIFKVERSANDENIHKLHSSNGTYLIARDFFGIWVELTSKPGSARIHLSLIGTQIEKHYKAAGLV